MKILASVVSAVVLAVLFAAADRATHPLDLVGGSFVIEMA